MVKRSGLVDNLVVSADGKGQVGHAGSALLVGVADRLGLTAALSGAMAPTRERRSAHDPGVVLRDLAVTLADGGDALGDLRVLRDQPDLYGRVASDATAFRVIDSVDDACLERLRGAVAKARAQAWRLGVRPKRLIFDVDATLVDSGSDEEQAAGTFKKGYGHHPLLCYLDGSREALSSELRPGNAGSNTAEDHKLVGDLALDQLPEGALQEELLLRADGAGATHELAQWCRDARIYFSVGFDLDQRVRAAITKIGAEDWVSATQEDGKERPGSQVAELTDRVNLAAWPERSRLLCRRVELTDGDQLSLADQDGYRHEVFLTDQPGADLAKLDLDHRGHARVEQRIRDGKDCGLENLPFHEFQHNRVWLWLVGLAQDLIAWAQALTLTDQPESPDQPALTRCEPRRLRYALLHQSGRLVHHARRTILRLGRDWPWASELAAAFARLQALPHPA